MLHRLIIMRDARTTWTAQTKLYRIKQSMLSMVRPGKSKIILFEFSILICTVENLQGIKLASVQRLMQALSEEDSSNKLFLS